MSKELIRLCEKEGWDIIEGKVHNASGIYELDHPYKIYSKIYRDKFDPEERFQAMHKIHDILWPEHYKTWNDWQETMYRAHCGDYEQVVNCGGAGIGKSATWAKIGIQFWLADQKRRGVVVASTTLDAVETRIWGYVVKYFMEMKLKVPWKYLQGSNPKVIHPNYPVKNYQMAAVAIPLGADEKKISGIIGRHPEGGLMLILDEATEMPPALLNALPNLKRGTECFQLAAIGNSKDRDDTHGALATPKNGWDSIDKDRDDCWETTNYKGIALYFNPYKSPAITDPDPEKRERLGKFLIKAEDIKVAEETHGVDSETFWRFTLGFWPPKSLSSSAVLSKDFLTESEVSQKAEWSGFYPLEMVAGLDPAFKFGTRGCVLRLAVVGQSVDGKVRLDYKGEDLIFRINLNVSREVSPEMQICRQVLKILNDYKIPLERLAIDTTGQGRALGELLRVEAGAKVGPFKIYTKKPRVYNTKGLKKNVLAELDVITISASELWFAFRDFVQEGQIRGLDEATIDQIINRKTVLKGGLYEIESKDEYRSRMMVINAKKAHSPDEADACMLTIQSAKLGLGLYPGMTKELRKIVDVDYYTQQVMAYNLEQAQKVVTGGPSILVPNTEQLKRSALVPNFSARLEDTLK